MTKPGVSVIITFYNEVEYLDVALTSVLSQQIDGLEVIIINDNPDRFDDSFFETAGYSDKARVVHHEINKGLSAARNTGIHAATRDHIAFLDADDYYLPRGLEKHYAYARNCGADIVHGHTILTRMNQNAGQLLFADVNMPKTQVLTGQARLTEALDRINSWGSIYRRAFLIEKNVSFDAAQRKFEDRLFIIESMIAADTVAIFAKPVRVWRRRANSITTSKKSLEETGMKLALVEKCVAAWNEVPDEDRRFFQSAEFVRHALNIVFQDDIAAWVHLEDGEFAEESKELTARLQHLAARLDVTLEEVRTSLRIYKKRFAEFKTGNDRITPEDLHRFITAIIDGDNDEMNRISLKARREEPGIPALTASSTDSQTPETDLKIYVHFGTHKTGSTFIQQQLKANYDTLKSHGVLFPKTGLGFPHDKGPVRPDGLPGHQALIKAMAQSDQKVIAELHREIEESGCNKVIISAENLGAYHTNKEGMNSVAIARNLSRLGLQGTFIPVIYFRRPDRWIESFYREQVGNGAAVAHQTPDEYFNNQHNRLNYAATTRSIEEALDHEARLASFDTVVRGEGILQSFLRLCDSADVIDHITISETAGRYESPCNAQIVVSRYISSLVNDHTMRAEILRNFFTVTSPTDQKSPLLSAESQARAIEIFKTTSEQFFKDRGIEMNADDWKPSPQSEGTSIPDSYLEIMAQLGVIHQTASNSKTLVELTPVSKSKTPSKAVPKARKVENQDYKKALKSAPKPIRAFARLYLKATENQVYKNVRNRIVD